MNKSEIDKIDVEELMNDFRIQDYEALQIYLKELWKDLSQRSDDKIKGINNVTFAFYYQLPGIILDRLFNVFDVNNNQYIDLNEFVEGMSTLFTDNFDNLVKFIFKFYDFDNDGLINKEDIRTVLSYVPLNNNNKYRKDKMKFEQTEFKDRLESQEELKIILTEVFEKSPTLDCKGFVNIVENKCSEIFLYLIIFLLEKRPFNKKTLDAYSGLKKGCMKSPEISKKLIASPSLQSKFSPSIAIGKSPTMTKKTLGDKSNAVNEGISMLNKLTGKPEESKNRLLGYTKGGEIKETKEEELIGKSNPIRKKMKELKNFEDISTTKDIILKNVEIKSPSLAPARKYETENRIGIKNDAIDDDDEEEVRNEGFLYKVTNNQKFKKLWFKQIDKDLYYYREVEETVHKGMHNLSGVFIEEPKEKVNIEGNDYYTFSIIYPKKTRIYYVDNKEDYERWINSIKKAIGYSNLTDNYEVKQKLGNGKFGLVKLGIHKNSGRKVAIKIINKNNMSLEDQGLVKTEIEILKICQHPNIIKLYDVFENVDNIYIIMEYCSGGDLFTYIEQRGFKLPEKRACELIHKLSMSIAYLHSYGIAHRDLKPENILMTDNTDTADIRLLDFGLSKIIGPNETCTEPYGTLSYVAPEVLLEKPYDKSVDLWTIGIITYLLLCGILPFDHDTSEKEIARMTIHEKTPFPGVFWKKLSSEAKQFVENLLDKNPNKRMSIKEVLEHQWIQKYTKEGLVEQRKKSGDLTNDLKLFVSSAD